VTDVSPAEAFAVGECVSQATGYIEQWNGSAWTMDTLPSPNSGATSSLSSVSADSATDAWTVGSYLSSADRYEPYSLHYNGSTWSTESSPDAGTADLLAGAAAISGGADVWAAGYSQTSGSDNPLVLETPG
jgi:hypothetical protein